MKKRTNQQNAQIDFGLIHLLLFNHSNMSQHSTAITSRREYINTTAF